ncbi:hypothetical protein G647_00457 [Cladophialophora carrionii CBS 160.54]|uniref:F-box domain-containing protein n=1 Tax=Cladophialophora carrionii CBS 160.54 TaxID=1279043 RepID=V9DNX5_9EURO|nr:uncharacterized protein G647_00457 [Cladophialophora carrionii CBS 160.54]ETI28008.1 hypothetical protein G647_00457 [Cladophialophora carrionii CBS 160.54]
MSLNAFPDEVIVKICAHLDFQSNANLRLSSKRLSQAGGEALVKRVRFHCAEQSLKRFHAIAHDAVLSKYVDTIVFEANLLATIRCVHTFQAHYHLEDHDRPRPPPHDASVREKRLYERNVAKFNLAIKKKYDRYLALYDTQQKFLSSTICSEMIDPSMLCFPRLTKVVLSTVGRCKHVLSGRFMESFAPDVTMPIGLDSKHTKDQLRHLLFPSGQPLTGLKALEVRVLTPKFFSGFLPSDMLCLAFQNLRIIDLDFRLEKDDFTPLQRSNIRQHYADLANGLLRNALCAANDLEQLTVNFDDDGYHGSVADLDKILGNKAWPKLEMLNIDCMSTTEDELMDLLNRQPSLKDLRLGFMHLREGRWLSATTSMRKELKLHDFIPTGIFEDSGQMYPMHHLDGDAYTEDFSHISLGEALGLWVVHGTKSPGGNEYHPLLDDNFTDPDELRDQYGPFMEDGEFSDSDSDSHSDMDCDSD